MDWATILSPNPQSPSMLRRKTVQILTQNFGLGCDNSWMNDGLVSLKDREKKMMGSATPTDSTAIKAKDEIIRLLNEVEAKTFAEVQSENSLVLN